MTTLGYVCSKITFKYTCDFILNTLNDVYRWKWISSEQGLDNGSGYHDGMHLKSK